MSLEEGFDRFVKSLEEKFTPGDETIKFAIDKQREIVKEFVEERNLNALVIGLRGEINSSVIAALCQEQYTGVPLIGVVFQSHNRTNQAHWVGRNFCTEYFDPGVVTLSDGVNEDLEKAQMMLKLKGYLENNDSIPTMESRLQLAIMEDIAQKANGIALGVHTWSERFLFDERLSFSPLHNINKGYELPLIAKELAIPANIILDVIDLEERIGATFKEVDVIMNAVHANMDDNLLTQYQRYHTIDKIIKVTLRAGMNAMYRSSWLHTAQKRDVLKLPVFFEY